MSVTPQDTNYLLSTLEGSQSVLYGSVAATTFMAYDIILKLDEELDYIWKRGWSIIKVVYIFGRYYALIYTLVSFTVNSRPSAGLSSKLSVFISCRLWFWYLIMGGYVVFPGIMNIILVKHISALYRSRRVLVALIFLTVAETFFELYGATKAASDFVHGFVLVPAGVPYHGCPTNAHPPLMLMALIPGLVVTAVLLCMSLFETFRNACHNNLRIHKHSFSYILVRDGVVFFSLIFGTMLIHTIITALMRGPMIGFFSVWTVPVYSYACSRLILNIREAADEISEIPMTPMSPITFQHCDGPRQLGTLPFSFPFRA